VGSIDVPGAKKIGETSPLMLAHETNKPKMARYGSIIGSPSSRPGLLDERDKLDQEREAEAEAQPTFGNPFAIGDRPPSLKLPDPALKPPGSSAAAAAKRSQQISTAGKKKSVRIGGTEAQEAESAYEAGKTKSPIRPTFRSRHMSLGLFDRFRTMSVAGPSPLRTFQDYDLDVYKEIESAYNEFFGFLDDELEKIEEFYKEKEEESTRRLDILREQLHVLRDHRLDDLMKQRQSTASWRTAQQSITTTGAEADSDSDDERIVKPRHSWLRRWDRTWEAAVNGRIGKKSVAMETETTPIAFRPDDRQDYVRRPNEDRVPYRTAKRKLKLAMQEYYRGLELLKSYAMLNRTAFRKINKKYDKNLNSRPSGNYINEKVSKAYFIHSNVLDDHIQVVEDLYARYFEAGNKKIAANKLRRSARFKDYHGGAMFRNGIFLATGLIFGIEGLVNAAEYLYGKEQPLATNTSYLLQIYAGYFMMLLLMLFFAMATRFWTINKVNYVFVFEFEMRDYLDWRQILELPSLFTAFLGFFMWINFTRYGADDMYIYYPIVLITLTAAVIFCPLPIMYQRARRWFIIACVSLHGKVAKLTMTVPITSLWLLSGRISRLLPRRHVLFNGLLHGQYRALFLSLCPALV
jgi:hypothetical protein